MDSRLRLLSGDGRALEIGRGGVLLGRDPSCDVVFEDKSVSRRHACIERRGPGWAVVDQGSANGTFLDGQPITDAPLSNGQELHLGTVALRVQIEGDVPGTILMEQGTAMGAVPMPQPAGTPAHHDPRTAPRDWGAQPGPGAPQPAYFVPQPDIAPPPPAYGRLRLAYAAPQEAYAPPSPSPQEAAAALLGVHPGATAAQVSARYEELSADLSAKLAGATTPQLKLAYQTSIDELRKACDIIAPGALLHGIEADLPSARPLVDPGQVDMELPAAIRVAIQPPPEAEKKSGAPSPLTTFFAFTAFILMAAFAYFGMSSLKMRKQFKRWTGSSEIAAAYRTADKLAVADTLEKNGVLKNGVFKLCNKGSRPVAVKWLGVIYSDISDEGNYSVKVFNSAYCAKSEFELVVPAGSEVTPTAQGLDHRCHLAGEGIFFGMRTADAKNPGRTSRMGGALNGREGCITVGEG